jgi:hypothetical protein
LSLVSPDQLVSLMESDAALVEALRADGTVEYHASGAQPLIAVLGLKARASSSEKKARQELLGEFGATVTPEEMDTIREGWPRRAVVVSSAREIFDETTQLA